VQGPKPKLNESVGTKTHLNKKKKKKEIHHGRWDMEILRIGRQSRGSY